MLHLAFAFADHLPPGLGIVTIVPAAGQAAVLLFFIVSGYVMVIASRGATGRVGAIWPFWRRRLIRIMPPYWIATFVLAAVFLTVQSQPVDPVQFLKSLVLLPYWPPDGGLRPVPFLWVGWTLFYEMVFYAVFGLFLGLRRRWGLAATVGVLGALVLAGTMVPPDNAPLFALTRPAVLMFLPGVALAQWRSMGGSMPGWLRAALLVAAVPVAILIPAPTNIEAMGIDYLIWSGLTAGLVAGAVLGGPLALPARRSIIAAGDMSYALYLLHVPVAWFWLWAWGQLPFFDAGPWDFFLSALAASLLAASLFHTWIERPLTQALNRLAATPHERNPSP